MAKAPFPPAAEGKAKGNPFAKKAGAAEKPKGNPFAKKSGAKAGMPPPFMKGK